MKVESRSGLDIHRVLGGMVTDPIVCGRIAKQWRDDGLFESPWANTVGTWCVKHLQKYGSPPNGQLRTIFDHWASKPNRDEATVDMVERFLAYCSEQFSQEGPYNSDYLTDVAGRYFNRVRMKQTLRQAEEELDDGNLDKAHEILAGMRKVELGEGSLAKTHEDYDMWEASMNTERQRSLIDYPGRMDVALGSRLQPGCLVAFMGPDKCGKSFFLLDAAYRAADNRHRVAYIEAGDMTREDVIVRLGQRAAGRPWRQKRWRVPTGWAEDGKAVFEERSQDEALTGAEAFHAFRRRVRGRDLFRLTCHPNSTLSVAGIESMLTDWAVEGWVPEVVVIDYADILAPPEGVRETLDQVDTTWRHLRRLSQRMHCLVLTATQSNAAAYKVGGRMLGRQHFSGRKTKLAHVSGMIGINVGPGDKEQQTCRLNWVVLREGVFYGDKSIRVAGCLAISNPAMVA